MYAHLLFTTAFAAGVMSVVGAAPAEAEPVTQTYAIAVDTYLDSQSPTTNYGSATTAKVVVNGIDGSLCRALFEIPAEVWSIPQADLISAKVWFYTFRDSTSDRNVRLHPLGRGFVETGATWNTYNGINAWTSAGGDYDGDVFVDAVKGANWFSWDITALWTDVALRSYGAILRMSDESNPGPGYMPRAPFTSSDGAEGQRPYIEVTYVPEPYALWSISVPVGLEMLRRRK